MVKIRESVGPVKEGAEFGKWTVISPVYRLRETSRAVRWVVTSRCECGTIAVHRLSDLTKLLSVQCKSCASTVHGFAKRERLYDVWIVMRERCNNPNDQAAKNYGGRGIRVCDEWNDYTAFRTWALTNGYADNLEIDRRETNGNYEPGNCRWVTRKVNARNRRNTITVTAFGETKTIGEWADDVRCFVSYTTLYGRVRKQWEPELAIVTPHRSARRAGVSNAVGTLPT